MHLILRLVERKTSRVSIVFGVRSVQIETAAHFGAETSFPGGSSSFLKHEPQLLSKREVGTLAFEALFISNPSFLCDRKSRFCNR